MFEAPARRVALSSPRFARPQASGGEGTRVVFVSVRGRDAALPRTRRKRALGVADGTTYEAFVQQLCARLQLRGVKAIFHAASGAPVRSLDEVADVEDLEVEARPPNPTPPTRLQRSQRRRHTPHAHAACLTRACRAGG